MLKETHIFVQYTCALPLDIQEKVNINALDACMLGIFGCFTFFTLIQVYLRQRGKIIEKQFQDKMTEVIDFTL